MTSESTRTLTHNLHDKYFSSRDNFKKTVIVVVNAFINEKFNPESFGPARSAIVAEGN